jgi:alpha-1,3-rhamnosyl/mannosyltransferase
MEQELPNALKRADLLITDSEFTKQELIKFSGFSSSKVLSIPLAASSEFEPRDQAKCAEVLSRFQLTYKGYLLYAGTIEPRKNLITLLDAFEKIPFRLRHEFPLVIAGFSGWSNEQILKRINRGVDAGWVKYLGFVPSDELPVLFAGAKTFIFPSVYEGFGLPVLEAIASGTPVVCSNSSSLPEVAGGCALMCDPGDIDSLSQLLVQSIEDEQWRATAIENVLIHASKFSWQETASKTMEAYKLAYSSWTQ